MNKVISNNGYPKFNDLEDYIQRVIEQRYVIPNNEQYLFVDEYYRPFIQEPNSIKLYCTIRKEALIDNGFHTYFNR